jgi:hypothetical protein
MQYDTAVLIVQFAGKGLKEIPALVGVPANNLKF